jgi:tRNA1Val (adenine37-N6)-methyltransferase
MSTQPFQFKQFSIHQENCLMKVGTDGVLLGAWADAQNAASILDIGTGTGVIAIMLAQRSPAEQIVGVEIDEQSYVQARQNMNAAPWNDRLEAVHAPIQDYSKIYHAGFDLIVSNPPFFSGGTFSKDQDRTSVRHTVKLPHGDLLRAVQRLLNPKGRFCVILPYIEGLRFQELAENYMLYPTKKMEVRGKAGKPVERILLQFEKQKKDIVQQPELTIRAASKTEEWTGPYKELTADFYLHF